MPDDAESSGRWERLSEEERDLANWERANRRAAAKLRRYMVSNLLVYMWVLTLSEGRHGPDGRREVMRLCGEFARHVRDELGVEVYAYSPELHPGGHGWHVNFFVGKYLPHAEVAKLWGHGHVWVSDWRRKVRKRPGQSPTQLAKNAALHGARYAAKYAEKDWSRDVLETGVHRFERSEGGDPVLVEAEATTMVEVLRAVMVKVDGPAEFVWSDDVDDYHGPPWVFVRWEPDR